MKTSDTNRKNNRRSFLRSSVTTGAAVAGANALLGGKLFGQDSDAFENSRRLRRGDAAILRFLAAAELIEADLWQQYAELGGLTPGQLPVEADPSFTPMNSYQNAMMQLDPDGPQYISSNTLDEKSHADFLNKYLASKGEEPVDLKEFSNLPSSTAGDAQQIGRLTNLMHLNVDTSWYTRYRSTTNPDFGATFPQAIELKNVPAIPRTNADLGLSNIQAIANIAAFHFASIEQGGSSLYATLSRKVSSEEVLRITLSIGGDEIAHFLEWVDFSGNSVQPPVAPLAAANGLPAFPNFDALVEINGKKTVNPLLQTNLIFPVPCEFISPDLPKCAVIRPTAFGQIDAKGAAKALTASNLFLGQPQSFFDLLFTLAEEADAARRER